MSSSAEFIGMTCLVTGGGRGLGRAIADRLASEGASVYICGRNAPEDIGSLRFIACDVRDVESAERMLVQIVAETGRLDVLVNNAGGSPMVDASKAPPRLSQSVIALNLLAPLNLSTLAYGVMEGQAGGGCIINIASISGTRPSPGTAAYGAAKAGLINLTQSLAMEWGPHVRVNAVIVGLVGMEGGEEHYGSKRAREQIDASIPMRRMATGADVASCVRYLASREAAYITGARIEVHGGGERPLFLDLARDAGN